MKRLPVLLCVIFVANAAAIGRGLDLDDLGLPSSLDVAAEHLRASAVPSHTTVAAGREFHVAVEVLIGDGWVYYSSNPGKIAKPANITVEAEDLVVGDILWPPDRPYETDLGDGEKLINHVYQKRAVIFVPLTVPAEAKPGERTIMVVVDGQICSKVCIDVETAASAVVTVGPNAVANDAWSAELVDGLRAAMSGEPRVPSGAEALSVWAGLGLALLAGLILNIMPCVLPVIPLRILSLVQMAGENRRRFITLGLAFAGGIVLFFIALAAANIAFTTIAQQTLNLNVHLQYRPVRIALALVLVGLAGNLFGLFHVTVPTRLAGLGQGEPGRKTQGHLAVAGMGLMMAVLATPCSFAILAAALTWAQFQPLALATLGIIMIGVGMAAPHAVLVAFPNLVNKLPKPGRWMELLREGMGLILLPVALWLILAGSEDTYTGWVIAYAIVLAMCLWIWGKWVRYDASLRRKLIVRGLAVMLAVAAGFWMLSPSRPLAVAFEPFNHQRIDDAHRNGQAVLLKFTSATCVSCIILDRTVYNDAQVAEELARRNIVAMKADTTDADSPASKMLKDRFRGAPPLTVILAPGGARPIRLEGKFSKADLLKALDAAAEDR